MQSRFGKGIFYLCFYKIYILHRLSFLFKYIERASRAHVRSIFKSGWQQQRAAFIFCFATHSFLRDFPWEGADSEKGSRWVTHGVPRGQQNGNLLLQKAADHLELNLTRACCFDQPRAVLARGELTITHVRKGMRKGSRSNCAH